MHGQTLLDLERNDTVRSLFDIQFGQKLLIIVSLLPLSINFFGDTVNANYTLILLVVSSLHRNPLNIPKKSFFFYVIIFPLIIYLTSIRYLLNFEIYSFLRASISFVLFFSTLMLSFIHLKFSLEFFEKSIVVLSVLYSLWVVITIYIYNIPLSDGVALKGILRQYVWDWPQRYIILLLPSLFLSLKYSKNDKRYYLATFVISVVVILSYTRAAWISAIFGFLLIFLFGSFRKKMIFSFFLMTFFALIPKESLVKYSRLLSTVSTAYENRSQLDESSSEGSRLLIWKDIGEYVSRSPFFGSSYLGASYAVQHGAAHSQYFDVLLRVGWFYFVLIVFLLLFCTTELFQMSYYSFAALSSFLLYGIFHETWKLSYGAVYFFITLNYTLRSYYGRIRRLL
jgi:O-antigen ligase